MQAPPLIAVAPQGALVASPSPAKQTLQQSSYAGILSLLSRPIIYVIGCLGLFSITFGYIFIMSGINLNSIDTSHLNVWWVGTLITSCIMLLVFYLVFHTGGFFNKAIIVLLLLTFIFIHISLLLTQMNLRV